MAGAKRDVHHQAAGLCFAQAAGAQIVELVLVETAHAGGVLALDLLLTAEDDGGRYGCGRWG